MKTTIPKLSVVGECGERMTTVTRRKIIKMQPLLRTLPMRLTGMGNKKHRKALKNKFPTSAMQSNHSTCEINNSWGTSMKMGSLFSTARAECVMHGWIVSGRLMTMKSPTSWSRKLKKGGGFSPCTKQESS